MDSGFAKASGLKREFVALASATVAAQASRLITFAVVASWLGPSEIGKWNALQLLLVFGGAVALGAPQGLGVELPRLIGAGQKGDAQQLDSSTSIFYFAVTTGAGLLCVGASLAGIGGEVYARPLRWMGLLLPSWLIYQFVLMRLRSLVRFRAVYVLQWSLAVLLPAVTLPCAQAFGLEGFIGGQALVTLGLVLAAGLGGGVNLRHGFTWTWVRVAITHGSPLLAAALIYGLLISVDRLMVLEFMGSEALGHYTLPILCVTAMSLLPSVISQQLYPRMAYRFGQTGNAADLRESLLRQLMATAAVVFPVLLFAYFALEPATLWFLPEYEAGVAPARVVLLGLAFLALGGAAANLLTVSGHRTAYVAINAGAVVACAVVDWALLQQGMGLMGVAYGATVAFAGHAGALHVTAYLVTRR